MPERDEILNTLSRFMNSFDRKDWPRMQDLLEPKVRVDYSSLRGDPPTELSAAEYVESRSKALRDVATHHLLGNVDISVSGESARAAASCMIWRRKDTTAFDSHAFYVFSLVRHGSSWRIAGIEQRIYWSEGDPTIHGGIGRGRA